MELKKTEKLKNFIALTDKIKRDKFCLVTIRPKHGVFELIGKYKHFPHKDDEKNQIHWRTINMNWFGVSAFTDIDAVNKERVLKTTLKSVAPKELKLDLSQPDDQMVLAWLIEHPQAEVIGYTNKYSEGKETQFQVVIRALQIEKDSTEIIDGMTIANEVWTNDYYTNRRLTYFLGGDARGKTEQELKTLLIGTDFMGLAMVNKVDYERFVRFDSPKREMESLVKQAIKQGFITHSDNSYKAEDGTPLGQTIDDCIAWYESKSQAYGILRSSMLKKEEEEHKPEIYADSERVVKSIGKDIPEAERRIVRPTGKK